jgi:serine/threonine protein phosphatase PrpC
MGGHSEGQRASQLAARIVGRDVMSQIFPPFLQIDNSEPAEPVQSILESSLQAANWEVQAGNPESGTTLTAALVLGERLFVAHVGDSRAYMIQDKESPAERLTLDHSFVQRLQDTGQITAEEAATHPQRNILYRAIGQGERLDVDTFSRPIPRPSWLVLCSDGLWGEVGDESIKASVTSAATPQQACDEMIEAALEAGGPDNITVIVIQFE